MSDPQRGAYTPHSDAPLSFDARQPVRGGGQPPITLIISAGILVVLVAAIFFVYRGGVRGAGDAPQPVGAPVGQIKDAAPQTAQTADPASGLQIYKTDEDGQPTQPNFAPAPEPPLPRPAPQAQPTMPVTSAPLPPPTAAAPQATPVLRPSPAPTAPVAAPAAAPTPRPTPPQTIAAAAGAAVQIGAFSSQAQADAGWTAAARISPGLAAGKGKSVEAIERDGKTLFRTAVTGFETRAQADSFCSALKAAGKTCFVR